MIEPLLLSNSSYHVASLPSGGGYSRWGKLAVTRWREDAGLAGCGVGLFLRDEATGAAWSPRAGQPSGEHGIATTLSSSVDSDADLELRRLHIVNDMARPRMLSCTSLVEVVLAPPAADAAHPAFSKLFVETRIDREMAAVFAARRPSKADEVRGWLFHKAAVHGVDATLSFDTDRARSSAVVMLPHAGRGGWTWYSGSAGGLYQLLVESLLGFERRGARLRLRPLLPAHWPGFAITYRFGRATYAIDCQAAPAAKGAITTVDGVPVADGWLTLVDDEAVHAVVVQVSREGAPRTAHREH